MKSLLVPLCVVLAIILCLLVSVVESASEDSSSGGGDGGGKPRRRVPRTPPPPPPCNSPLGSVNGWANGIPAYSNCNDDTTTYESSYINSQTHEQILEENDDRDGTIAKSHKFALPIGMKWQCVEYARRYMMTIHKVAFGDVDSAWQIWGIKNLFKSKDIAEEKKPSGFFSRFQNGHSTVPPDVHDVLIWEKEEPLAPHGHVGIVTGIHEDPQDGQVYIEIGEQNWGSLAWDGKNYSRRLKLIETSQSRFVSPQAGSGNAISRSLGGGKSIEENDAIEKEAPSSRRSATSVRGSRRGIRPMRSSRSHGRIDTDKALPLGARKRRGISSSSLDGAPLHTIPAGVDARDLATNPNFLNKAAYGIPDLSSGASTLSSSPSVIPEVANEDLEHPDTIISSVGSNSHPRYFLEDTIGLHIVGWLRPGTRDDKHSFYDVEKPRVEVDPSGERRRKTSSTKTQQQSEDSDASGGRSTTEIDTAPSAETPMSDSTADQQPTASIPNPPPSPPKKSPSPSKRVESTSIPRKDSDL